MSGTSKKSEEISLRGEIIDNDTSKDPKKALADLVDILNNQASSMSAEDAKKTVSQVLQNYETQLRVFVIGMAKNKLNRILKLMEIIEQTETVLLDPDKLQYASPFTLTRIWAGAQSALTTDLDFVQSVVEMRKRLEPADARTIINVLGNPTDEQLNTLSEVALSPQQRSRVRNILTGLIGNVNKDSGEE